MGSSHLNAMLERTGYVPPRASVVRIDSDGLMQGVVDVSGTEGPGTDPDNPVGPDDPDAGLANGSVWASPSDGQMP